MITLQFFMVLFLIFIAYAQQIFVILKKQSSHGISFQAYIVTCIACAALVLNADNLEVFQVAIFELILAIITMFLIVFFRSVDFTESYQNGIFLAAMLGSFFMLHGVTQTIKSYKENVMCNVSSVSYGIWIFQDILLLQLTKEHFIQIAIVSNIMMYLYIIYKNEKLKRGIIDG